MKELYIIGAGTYGEVMFELAEACGYRICGVLDDDESKTGCRFMDSAVIEKLSDREESFFEDKNFVVAIGNNETRYKIMNRILKSGGHTPTLIHPTATVSSSAEIGQGVYIQMGAVIWTKVKIGDFTIISPNTVIAHHTKIGKACLISTLCAVGASIDIGNFAMFGFESIAITGMHRIGNNVMLGAGTTLTKDVGDNVLMVGTPARKVKDRMPVNEIFYDIDKYNQFPSERK